MGSKKGTMLENLKLSLRKLQTFQMTKCKTQRHFLAWRQLKNVQIN